jgi:hypothetical protein
LAARAMVKVVSRATCTEHRTTCSPDARSFRAVLLDLASAVIPMPCFPRAASGRPEAVRLGDLCASLACLSGAVAADLGAAAPEKLCITAGKT